MMLVIGLIAFAMVAARFTAIYAFGEELNLLLEFGLSNLTLGGALLAVLCAVPVQRVQMVNAADRVLMTRALAPGWRFIGRWLGACVVIALAFVVWSLIFAGAVIWFADAEPTLFTMTRDTTAERELKAIVVPIVLVYLQTVLLAGVATGVASRGSLLAAASSVTFLLVFGVLLPDWASADDAGFVLEGLALILPDLRLSSVAETLYGEIDSASWLIATALQAIGYGALGALAGAILHR
ncbi:MAG: hypothetical protein L6Q71_11040 [Planctomycetes bacterium]|nr:hypothetical protein [Planctomycetota bacterium]NUQ33713.1 hypothetical protein [Planctomycetaceae bacterium]